MVVSLSSVWTLKPDDFAGDLLREVDFLWSGDFVLALVEMVGEVGVLRNGIILLAMAMGYDVDMNSQGSRSVRLL